MLPDTKNEIYKKNYNNAKCMTESKLFQWLLIQTLMFVSEVPAEISIT